MIAAEQKARSTYEYLMQMTDDPDVIEPLRFLREREVVHFQRFGEALRIVKDYLNSQNQFIITKPDCMKKPSYSDKMYCPDKKESVEKPDCSKSPSCSDRMHRPDRKECCRRPDYTEPSDCPCRKMK